MNQVVFLITVAFEIPIASISAPVTSSNHLLDPGAVAAGGGANDLGDHDNGNDLHFRTDSHLMGAAAAALNDDGYATNEYASFHHHSHPPPDYSMAGHHTFDTAAAAAAVALDEADLGQLSLEIERERHEYLEKSKHLNEQLQTLKGEIDALKVDDKMTVLDILHKEQQEQGNTKYSTIQKVKRGSATSRVAFFEEL